MGFNGKFCLVALVCAGVLFISGKSRYERSRQLVVEQTTLITLNQQLKSQVHELTQTNVFLADSLSSADSVLKTQDTLFVRVVGENRVLVKLAGNDIHELGAAIAKALKSDTSKVSVNVIQKRRGLFK